MANRDKADLILHPARTAILQALAQQPLTTGELANLLPRVPQPSLYRHLKLLLEAGMVTVSETRPVRGVLEKVYRLEANPHLNETDMSGMSKDEHLRYFTMYLAGLLQGFGDYLTLTAEPLDPLGDRMGYTEMSFYASREDLDEFLKVLQPALQKLAELKPLKNRVRRKLDIISFPMPAKTLEK